jgi:putative tricarboxylic transport membrane protein
MSARSTAVQFPPSFLACLGRRQTPPRPWTGGSFGSFFGGILGVFLLGVLVKISLMLDPSAFFALALFGLSAVVSMSKKNMAKGFISIILGVMLGSIGSDNFTGMTRFTMGMIQLGDGVSDVPAVVGFVAAAELFGQVIVQIQEKNLVSSMLGKLDYTFVTIKEFLAGIKVSLFSMVLGIVVGVMPGADPTVASFIAYNEGRRISKDGDKFGTGVPDGILAPEVTNNACVPATVVPLLSFGIPGSTSAAIMLGAMVMHGMRPGPLLSQNNPEALGAVFLGILLACPCLLIVGRLMMKPWVKVTAIPPHYLNTIILCLLVVGSLALNEGIFAVGILIVCAFLGYLMKLAGFNPIATVLGFVLSQLVEDNLHRTMLLSKGSLMTFVEHPITLALLVLTVASVVFGLVKGRKKEQKA